MDYVIPKEFASIGKEGIRDSSGLTYRDFRRSLKPRFSMVWLHIGGAYLVLFLTGAVMTIVDPATWWTRIGLAAGGACIFGYTIAFLQLFFHEAAHYNLAAKKETSDILANIFVGAPVGQDIRNYRPIHWGHHKFIGTTMDTEQTYFDPLNTRFILESLFGIKVFTVLAKREHNLKNAAEKQPVSGRGQLMLGLALNGTIVLAGLITGEILLAVAWTVGMLIVFPFFASVRQVLEHRDENAKADVDYHLIAHGVVNRLFGDGIIADTLGGAGFNRHLLHHWDPQVSYTRLKDLEEYLMDTPLAPSLKSRQTTYFRTFARLFNH